MTEEAPSPPKALHITLNPGGVADPAKRAVLIATQTVGTCMRALEADDLSPPSLGGPLGYRFDGLPDMTVDEKRAMFGNWLLSKAFQDLARGVRETLEEAIFYLEMIQMKSGMTTLEKIEADMAVIRAGAQKPSFPALLDRVNAQLREPMAFDAEFLSLQRVRNCLEHRGGIVGPKDVDPVTGTMALNFPRLKIFYMRGEEEIELVVGEAIDTWEPGNPIEGAKDVPVMLKRVTRTREYALGEPVAITMNDFAEIALACQMFADDLATKLPTLPPIADPVPA